MLRGDDLVDPSLPPSLTSEGPSSPFLPRPMAIAVAVYFGECFPLPHMHTLILARKGSMYGFFSLASKDDARRAEKCVNAGAFSESMMRSVGALFTVICTTWMVE